MAPSRILSQPTIKPESPELHFHPLSHQGNPMVRVRTHNVAQELRYLSFEPCPQLCWRKMLDYSLMRFLTPAQLRDEFRSQFCFLESTGRECFFLEQRVPVLFLWRQSIIMSSAVVYSTLGLPWWLSSKIICNRRDIGMGLVLLGIF